MAEEQPEGEEQAKSPVVKIVLIVVGILLLIVLSVVGTLFATGFFDAREQDNVEEQIAELEAEAEAEANDGEGEGEDGGEPKPVALESPELKKFKKSYLELEKNFVSNVKSSRKVIQVQIGVMTHYFVQLLCLFYLLNLELLVVPYEPQYQSLTTKHSKHFSLLNPH